jgi:ribonucleotide reductase alpha subunit
LSFDDPNLKYVLKYARYLYKENQRTHYYLLKSLERKNFDSEDAYNNAVRGQELFVEDMKNYGRRNIACLTIAPTGSVSLMTQTTSGIEPVFMPIYKRRRKVNPNEENVHVDFVDEHTGESFEEYIVFHPKFKVWMETKGIFAK